MILSGRVIIITYVCYCSILNYWDCFVLLKPCVVGISERSHQKVGRRVLVWSPAKFQMHLHSPSLLIKTIEKMIDRQTFKWYVSVNILHILGEENEITEMKFWHQLILVNMLLRKLHNAFCCRMIKNFVVSILKVHVVRGYFPGAFSSFKDDLRVLITTTYTRKGFMGGAQIHFNRYPKTSWVTE